MFKRNEERFGVTSSFDDDMKQYTTPMPQYDETSEEFKKANRLANEIMEKGNMHDDVRYDRSEEE